MSFKRKLKNQLESEINNFKASLKKEEICLNGEQFNPIKHKLVADNLWLERLNEKNYTTLGILEVVEGDINFDYSTIQNLGNLRLVGGYASFTSNLKILTLNKLEKVGGIDLIRTEILSLGELNTVASVADFRESKIKNLGKLKYVGMDINLSDSIVENLGDLEIVGRKVIANGNKLSSDEVISHLWSKNKRNLIDSNNLVYVGKWSDNLTNSIIHYDKKVEFYEGVKSAVSIVNNKMRINFFDNGYIAWDKTIATLPY